MILKLDKEQIANQLKAFRTLNGRKPYIICSMATYEMFPDEATPVTFLGSTYGGTIDLNFPSTKVKIEQKGATKFEYQNHIVFIDDALKLGEVMIV